MSMLSAQIDKLRYEADMLRDHGTFIGYGGLTSTDPEMIECADLMCDAADTIWQLRDDLQRTNSENAELREQIVRCRDCKHYADHEWVIATDVSDVCHFWASGVGVKVEPDGFCKWGERRTDK